MNHDECEKIERLQRERAAQDRRDKFAYRNALIEACDGNMKKARKLYQKHAEASALKSA
jgi:hypothetical protein